MRAEEIGALPWLAALFLAAALHALVLVGLGGSSLLDSRGTRAGSERPSARAGIRLSLAPAPGPDRAPAAESLPIHSARPRSLATRAVPPAKAPARLAQPPSPDRLVSSVRDNAAKARPADARSRDQLASAAEFPTLEPLQPASGEMEAPETATSLGASDILAGAGSQRAADNGDAGTGRDAAGDADNRAGQSSAYHRALHVRVENAQTYPRRAERRGIEGTVLLSVRLDRSGAIAHVEVRESSGSSLLDRAAIAAMERAAPFGRVPAAIDEADLEFDIPLDFGLR